MLICDCCPWIGLSNQRWLEHTHTQTHTHTNPHTLTMSELPLLFSFLWGGMGRRGGGSLRRRERSEFHASKLEGGRKGGMTAFSLSLGSRVSGAPSLSYGSPPADKQSNGLNT